MEPWKAAEIDQRLANLERELALRGGRDAMLLLAVRALIASHPDQEQYKLALRPMLADLRFPNPVFREGFDQVLAQVKEALAARPAPPTSPT